MTRPHLCALVLAASAAFCPAMAQEASTIRIEPRPFYGATVTLEEGVRVFRPLPAHKQVIINPGSRTPLNLGIYEERSVSHNYNYNYAEPAAVSPGVGFGGFGFDDFRRDRRRDRHLRFGRHDRHHHFHRRVPKRVH